ncbi:MAG: ATP-dependent Clp protease adapter ClpS [Candidatus Liberibacter europaeus]|uniref:ATP-dependent Clp protease adapter protein ClpS n=1 Tax=Candidatus Liberibacter europaeus TaxID=744859 RepID=A0A2T4VX60_9HYPH|nr:ATP-dependent Clp protease adapter ClpS [Candidatus Liberibacter europaeus]PTL86361.1 MAG: ATP-dependent Clp protease adapter ClpS [Candidatus Liberibacter europaeus]
MAEKRNSKKEEIGIDTFFNTKVDAKIQAPRLYRVFLVNDDYTPMDFVVHVLQRFFHKDHETAQCIMLKVHHDGIGECGVYTYEIAEMRVNKVMNYARHNHHPLQCIMKKK